MQYFTLQAYTLRDAIDKMKRHYGENARLLTHRGIKIGGILGFFAREGIEITGYLSDNTSRKTVPLEEKKKILEAAQKEQTLGKILKEIEILKGIVKSREHIQEDETKNSSIRRIKEILEQNDFTHNYIKKIIMKIRGEFSIDALNDFPKIERALVKWIGEQITIYPPFRIAKKKPTIYTIIGPTGVGKTTTIAKLAAIYGLGNKKHPTAQVRMITIDNYRIAAKKQIETYADIMQIPVTFAETYNDLKKVLALYQDMDLILIDTIGKSPSDFEKLGEMRRILSACGNTGETHLAISATTKASDVENILRQFEPFMYKSIILTKLDETSRIGNVLSVLSEQAKPISYITDGQVVPQDIEEAHALRLLMNIEGLRIERDHIETIFGRQDDVSTNNWR
ncbi:MAG: flagellar biosynthesis protein FlhF [Spirochaetales bacterium]|nr:flagellar biosynthesis protein FlhF [Spirochaetales bacterium]